MNILKTHFATPLILLSLIITLFLYTLNKAVHSETISKQCSEIIVGDIVHTVEHSNIDTFVVDLVFEQVNYHGQSPQCLAIIKNNPKTINGRTVYRNSKIVSFYEIKKIQ